MRPYREDHQVGHFGIDDPATAVVERMPFVVEYREDVDLSPGRPAPASADFVNIGIVSARTAPTSPASSRATACSAATMQGAAPGAQIVSARACTFGGGCTATALAEGMIDLVVNRRRRRRQHVDRRPARPQRRLQRPRQALRRARSTTRRPDRRLGRQQRPRRQHRRRPRRSPPTSSASRRRSARRPGGPTTAPGSTDDQGIFAFSSRGPRRTAASSPTSRRPGSAISTDAAWLPGSAGRRGRLRPAARLLDVQRHLDGVAAGHRRGGAAALGRQGDGPTASPGRAAHGALPTGRPDQGRPRDRAGHGLVDVAGAWSLLARAVAARYTVAAPVCTAISHFLRRPTAAPASTTGAPRRRRPGAGDDPDLRGQGDPHERPGRPTCTGCRGSATTARSRRRRR